MCFVSYRFTERASTKVGRISRRPQSARGLRTQEAGLFPAWSQQRRTVDRGISEDTQSASGRKKMAAEPLYVSLTNGSFWPGTETWETT